MKLVLLVVSRLNVPQTIHYSYVSQLLTNLAFFRPLGVIASVLWVRHGLRVVIRENGLWASIIVG